MPYARVSSHSSSRLEISRKPGLRSWLVFAVLIIGGVGATYHTPGVTLWTFIYCGLPLILGLYIFEEWEECVLDKTTDSVVVRSWNAVERLQYLLKIQFNPIIVSAKLSDIASVGIGDTTIEAVDSFSGTQPQSVCSGYRVVLYLRNGRSLGVTKTPTSGDRREQEKIEMKIREFLASIEVKSRDKPDHSDDVEVDCETSAESDTENNETVAVGWDLVTDIKGDNAQQNDCAKSNENSVLKKRE